MLEHTVVEGECLASIADEYGFHWKTLWSLSDNQNLCALRPNPNLLMPGDIVKIPDKKEKKESCAVDKAHRFKVNGVPAKLALQILEGGIARANEPYVAEVDGHKITGTTDGEGRLTITLPPRAQQGTLTVGPDDDQISYTLRLRCLLPASETLGLQRRLENLGYGACADENPPGPQTEAAVRSFQADHGLTVSGLLDDNTRQAIEKAHST